MNTLSFYIGLTVLCALGWSTFDLLRKRLVRDVPPAKLLWWMMVGQLPIFLLANLTVENHYLIIENYWLPGMFLVFTNIFGNILFLKGVQKGPLSQTIPMLSLNPILSSLFAWFFIGETLSGLQILGVVSICTGLFLLNGVGLIQSIRNGTFAEDKDTYWGILFMGCATFFTALNPVFDKLCLQSAPLPLHVAIMLTIKPLILLLYFRVSKQNLFETKTILKNKFYWLGVVVLAASIGTQLFIIQHLSIGIYDAFKRSISMMSSIFVGSVVFSEGLHLRKILSTLIIVSGMILIYSASV